HRRVDDRPALAALDGELEVGALGGAGELGDDEVLEVPGRGRPVDLGLGRLDVGGGDGVGMHERRSGHEAVRMVKTSSRRDGWELLLLASGVLTFWRTASNVSGAPVGTICS